MSFLAVNVAEARHKQHSDCHCSKEQRLEKRKEKHDKLANELSLTDAQKKQAKNLRKASAKKMKPIFKQIKKLRAELDEIRKDNKKDFEKVLTSTQKEKLKTIKTARKATRKAKCKCSKNK